MEGLVWTSDMTALLIRKRISGFIYISVVQTDAQQFIRLFLSHDHQGTQGANQREQ
jgi:hypothetical protein